MDYPDQLAPSADPRFRGGPWADELSTAAADHDGKTRSELVAVWSTVESAYQLEAIGQHADVLAQLRNWETFRLRTAQALLTEAPPG